MTVSVLLVWNNFIKNLLTTNLSTVSNFVNLLPRRLTVDLYHHRHVCCKPNLESIKYYLRHLREQLQNLLDFMESRMMPPPRLQIYLRPIMTLNFDLLHTKLVISCPCPADHLCDSFVKYRLHKFGNRRKNGRTSGQFENIEPLPASLAWRKRKDYRMNPQHPLLFVPMLRCRIS